MKKQTRLQKWANEETQLVRIRKDLHELLKKEAKKQDRSMYYLVNKLIMEEYSN